MVLESTGSRVAVLAIIASLVLMGGASLRQSGVGCTESIAGYEQSVECQTNYAGWSQITDAQGVVHECSVNDFGGSPYLVGYVNITSVVATTCGGNTTVRDVVVPGSSGVIRQSDILDTHGVIGHSCEGVPNSVPSAGGTIHCENWGRILVYNASVVWTIDNKTSVEGWGLQTGRHI